MKKGIPLKVLIGYLETLDQNVLERELNNVKFKCGTHLMQYASLYTTGQSNGASIQMVTKGNPHALDITYRAEAEYRALQTIDSICFGGDSNELLMDLVLEGTVFANVEAAALAFSSTIISSPYWLNTSSHLRLQGFRLPRGRKNYYLWTYKGIPLMMYVPELVALIQNACLVTEGEETCLITALGSFPVEHNPVGEYLVTLDDIAEITKQPSVRNVIKAELKSVKEIARNYKDHTYDYASVIRVLEQLYSGLDPLTVSLEDVSVIHSTVSRFYSYTAYHRHPDNLKTVTRLGYTSPTTGIVTFWITEPTRM